MRGKIYFFNLSIVNNRGLNYIKIKRERSRCIFRYISVLEIISDINSNIHSPKSRYNWTILTLPPPKYLNSYLKKIFRKPNCQNNYYILKSQIKFLDRFFNNLIKSSPLYLKISKIIDFSSFLNQNRIFSLLYTYARKKSAPLRVNTSLVNSNCQSNCQSNCNPNYKISTFVN